MIESFGNKLAEDLFYDRYSKEVRHFPSDLYRIARRKLLYLNDAGQLTDLSQPPGNRLEELRGNLKGYYSIRINDQWHVVFQWHGSSSSNVMVIDYH